MLRVSNLNSIKLSDCTNADTLASFNFYDDASCQMPVATFDAVPRTCHAPYVFNFSNPLLDIRPAGTVLNSCMNASTYGKPTVSISILIDFDVLNAAGRCAASPNSGGKDKLSAGDDVGITIGVCCASLPTRTPDAQFFSLPPSPPPSGRTLSRGCTALMA